MAEKRTLWPSNFIYIVAAIGCAAGLGNLWRFPMVAFEHGGAAFIVALILCNLLLVFPLMMMETAIGQKEQKAAPQAFEKLLPGTAWIQWIPAIGSLFILTYYTPIMAWAMKYFVLALNGSFIADPSNYFLTDIIQLSDGAGTLGNFQWGLLFALLIAYAFVYWSMRKEITSVSKVVKFTVTLPFLILLILILRGVTLPGASAGLAAFFIPDWSALKDIALWQAAIGQSFFSATLAFGYFIVTGSHRKEKAEIAKSSLWIIIGNLSVSLLAGIAVFSTLGFMAAQQGVDVSEAARGGPMLVFSVLPTAISMMPIAPTIFAALLFLTIITLAIDSIFGLMEIVINSFKDHKKVWTYHGIILSVITLVILGAIPFLFGAGLYYLDITDHFVGNHLFMIIGMLEAAVIAYGVGPAKIRSWINAGADGLIIGPWFDWLLRIIPIVLAVILVSVLKTEFEGPYGGGDYSTFYLTVFGYVPLGFTILAALFLGARTKA